MPEEWPALNRCHHDVPLVDYCRICEQDDHGEALVWVAWKDDREERDRFIGIAATLEGAQALCQALHQPPPPLEWDLSPLHGGNQVINAYAGLGDHYVITRETVHN